MASGKLAAPSAGVEAQRPGTPAGPPAAAPRPPRLLFSTLLPYALVAPSILLLLIITVYPLLYSLRISFYLFRFGKADEFVGLDQYTHLFSDSNFWQSLL